MKQIKTIAIALFVGAVSLTGLQAQNFGIKGGLNLSNLYTDEVDDQNVLAGFNVGVFTEIPLTESISIQPEIGYTTKGAELVYNNALLSGTAKFRLNYVEVPVLLKANLTDNFNLQFGPYAAFLVDSKVTNESSNATFNFEQNISKDDLNKFDMGLAAGIGFETDNFGMGLRYNYGLTTVGKERTVLGQTYTYPDSKNSVFSLYATIKL